MHSYISGRNSEKAIATHTIVLVIMMAMFAMIAFLLFLHWGGTTGVETSKASCAFKKIAYCTDWRVNNYNPLNRPDWGKAPTGCEEFGISEPANIDGNGDGVPDDCEGLL